MVAAAVNAFANSILVSADSAAIDEDLGVGRDVGLLAAAHHLVDHRAIVDVDQGVARNRGQFAAAIDVTRNVSREVICAQAIREIGRKVA